MTKDQTLLALGAMKCRFCPRRALKEVFFTPQNGELPEEAEILYLCEHCAKKGLPDGGNLLFVNDL